MDYGGQYDQMVAQLEASSGVVLRRHDPTKSEIDFAKTTLSNSFER